MHTSILCSAALFAISALATPTALSHGAAMEPRADVWEFQAFTDGGCTQGRVSYEGSGTQGCNLLSTKFGTPQSYKVTFNQQLLAIEFYNDNNVCANSASSGLFTPRTATLNKCYSAYSGMSLRSFQVFKP